VPSAAPPSGQQVELTHGAQRAVVVEVGGGLRGYEVDGVAVLDGYAEQAMADGGRGQPLVPWPNRLADGHYEWDGRQLQVPIDELARRNASHGFTRWLNWQVAARTTSRVTMAQTIHPRPGYPFTLAIEITYEVSDSGLRVSTRACNAGDAPLPYGLGFHPYLRPRATTVDDALLRLPARQELEVDERMLPTGAQHEARGFRTARRIGEQRIDACFTDLERDADGLARVILDDVTLWLDDHFRYVQVFTGDTLAPERRRQGLAVEPMTCPPNAFATGRDVVRLEPGAEHVAAWGVDKALTAF
jgi:aldose 1-epimerase